MATGGRIKVQDVSMQYITFEREKMQDYEPQIQIPYLPFRCCIVLNWPANLITGLKNISSGRKQIRQLTKFYSESFKKLQKSSDE